MKKRKINIKRGLSKTFLFLSIFFILFVTIGFISNTANASKTQELIEITVKPGDSLWCIADKYGNDNLDTRKVIHQIKELNKIGDIIYPGQVIFVPID